MATGRQTTRLIVQLGNGATPTEAFAHTCGSNSFTIKFTNNLGEATVLDCTDPLDVPAVIVRHLESQDTQITMAGMITTEALDTWRAWADGGTEKNIRVLFDETLANNGGYWTLSAFLQDFEFAKESSGKVTFTATIMGAGQRTWTDAAA